MMRLQAAPLARRMVGLVAVAFVCAVTGMAPSVVGSAAASDAGAIKACEYTISTSGGGVTAFIRVLDAAAPGTAGTFVFKGTDANHALRATLNKQGLVLLSFPVIRSGSETMSVTLATKPPTTGTFHFALSPAATDVAAANGCTPV